MTAIWSSGRLRRPAISLYAGPNNWSRTSCRRQFGLRRRAPSVATSVRCGALLAPTLFTGADLFIEPRTTCRSCPMGGPSPTSADHRHHDRQGAPDDRLVDLASGQQRPCSLETVPHFSPRWSPSGDRLAHVAAEGGNPQLYVRWTANGESARITGLPDSPESITWSPDGRRIAYAMFVPDDGPRLGSAWSGPRARSGPSRFQIIDAVTYRADGAGYFKPGYTHCSGFLPTAALPSSSTLGATTPAVPSPGLPTAARCCSAPTCRTTGSAT